MSFNVLNVTRYIGNGSKKTVVECVGTMHTVLILQLKHIMIIDV